jgi:hypothetical protein
VACGRELDGKPLEPVDSCSAALELVDTLDPFCEVRRDNGLHSTADLLLMISGL